ncbi:hypothetical protein [Legionella fallonii]|uniref:Uncharacterized protein n=1 Tax=Legionella fallonii LLAP-10 TaxID=1212491 RepID=A0A098G969_9GAMM|nr:hypothetical protein [Legionella fallonii]CEG59049.1 conserved protein of unknown function [Legionella fallonii LLAP-10]
MTRTGFFTRTPATLSFIHVGGEPFHAAAVAFIDALKKAPRVNETTLKVVLDRFFAHYPKLKSQQPYLTLAERMDILINGPRKSEIVECMAFVLRQLAVDEIYAKPLEYKEVFDGLDSSTPKSYLRDPATPMPVSALRALPQVLGITFVLSHVEHGKELRSREIYANSSVDTFKLELVLQVQGEQCFPRVKNKTDFAYVGKLAINPPQPVENDSEKNSTIAEILSLINQDNKRLLHSYLQSRQNLLATIDEHKLSNSDIIQVYMEFLPGTYSPHNDSSQFFAKLVDAVTTPAAVEKLGSSSKQINDGLVSSLAGWISMNKIDEEQLFERMEESSSRTASPAA